MIPSYEAKRLLLPQQVDGSHISGGKFYWPFAIAPPNPSLPPPSPCSTLDSSLGHQSSSSGGAGIPTFQLIVTICRRGRLTRNVGFVISPSCHEASLTTCVGLRVRQQILYISPPDPSVRSSPQAISVDLPHDPPAITSWLRQNFPAVNVEGVIFDQDYVQVECNVSNGYQPALLVYLNFFLAHLTRMSMSSASVVPLFTNA
jgi:hypothetical protein